MQTAEHNASWWFIGTGSDVALRVCQRAPAVRERHGRLGYLAPLQSSWAWHCRTQLGMPQVLAALLWYAISAKSRILAPLDHIGVVTYALLVACTGTPTVSTALAVPYDYAPAVARVLGPTIAMSVTILKL